MSPFAFGKKLVHEIHEIDAEGIALHPHQRRRVILFGLLIGAIALAIGAQLIESNRTANAAKLKQVGAISISGAELQRKASSLKLTWKPYWLGEMAGMRYATDTTSKDEFALHYIRPADDPALYGANVFTVETYQDEATFKEDLKQQDFSTESTLTTALGRKVKYHSQTMAYFEVRVPEITKVVEIHADHRLTVGEIEKLADSLRPFT